MPRFVYLAAAITAAAFGALLVCYAPALYNGVNQLAGLSALGFGLWLGVLCLLLAAKGCGPAPRQTRAQRARQRGYYARRQRARWAAIRNGHACQPARHWGAWLHRARAGRLRV